MANYTTTTSDKSKKKAIRLLLCGGIGLHRFYVGKIKSGIVHLIAGLLLWITIFTSTSKKDHEVLLLAFIVLILLNLFDLLKLLLGKFQDNVGQYLRQ